MDTPPRLVLLGHPVAHSISPLFQNAALQAARIPLRYELMDVAPSDLDAALATLRRERVAGNVTIPLKEMIAERCDRLSPLAARVGAANVFWHEDGELVGDNSDVGGAEMVIRALLGKRAPGKLALIGAGGSAASVLVAAERCGFSSAVIYNRNMDRATQLAHRFPALAKPASEVGEALHGATLVVNATPVGLHDSAFPVPIEVLPAHCAVFDLVYTRGETAWVTAARAAGHSAADGEGMLLEQGALAFERWFGFAPDRNAMWKAIH